MFLLCTGKGLASRFCICGSYCTWLTFSWTRPICPALTLWQWPCQCAYLSLYPWWCCQRLLTQDIWSGALHPVSVLKGRLMVAHLLPVLVPVSSSDWSWVQSISKQFGTCSWGVVGLLESVMWWPHHQQTGTHMGSSSDTSILPSISRGWTCCHLTLSWDIGPLQQTQKHASVRTVKNMPNMQPCFTLQHMSNDLNAKPS